MCSLGPCNSTSKNLYLGKPSRYRHRGAHTRMFITALSKSSMKVDITRISVNKEIEHTIEIQNDAVDAFVKEGQSILLKEKIIPKVMTTNI